MDEEELAIPTWVVLGCLRGGGWLVEALPLVALTGGGAALCAVAGEALLTVALGAAGGLALLPEASGGMGAGGLTAASTDALLRSLCLARLPAVRSSRCWVPATPLRSARVEFWWTRCKKVGECVPVSLSPNPKVGLGTAHTPCEATFHHCSVMPRIMRNPTQSLFWNSNEEVPQTGVLGGVSVGHVGWSQGNISARDG